MEKDYVGKTIKTENGEVFVVLGQVKYKNIQCVYAMKTTNDDSEGEKRFFQITNGEKKQLVAVESKKMVDTLLDIMFKENMKTKKPRKIKDNESITDYFAYLDDYYKTRVNTVL